MDKFSEKITEQYDLLHRIYEDKDGYGLHSLCAFDDHCLTS
jgi:hypothetical protein